MFGRCTVFRFSFCRLDSTEGLHEKLASMLCPSRLQHARTGSKKRFQRRETASKETETGDPPRTAGEGSAHKETARGMG